MNKDKEFVIISSDDEEFVVDDTIINSSSTLKTLLFEQSGPDNCNIIIVDYISSETLSHIITFIKYNIAFENTEEFNKTFIKNMDIDSLLDIIIASKYLDIKEMFELGERRFKNIIKKTPEKIRQILNIENDFD